jgi:SAM-dependent methyltransferase
MTDSADDRTIFDVAARRAKRRRAAAGFAGHDFLHRRAAEDLVLRLELAMRGFAPALFTGPGGPLAAEMLSAEAEVGEVVLQDEIDAGPLPYPDGHFELVASMMELHAVNDVPAALRAARRVLAPDGLFIAIFPGERSLRELREALREAEAQTTGRVAARVSPFVAVREGGGLLQAAGFALPVADIDHVTVSYAEFGRLLADLRGAGETSILRAGPKGAMRRDTRAALEAIYAARFPAAKGGVTASVDLLTLTGWAPHPRQQKPLAPGSATHSLADAIKGGGED